MQVRQTGQWGLVLVAVTALLIWARAGAARDAQPPRAADLDAWPPHGCAEPGIDAQIAQGDSFHNERFPDLKADIILANPPFNVSDWPGEPIRQDKHWPYGVPYARSLKSCRMVRSRTGAALHLPSDAERDWGLRARRRIDVVQPGRRGQYPQGHNRGGSGGLPGGTAGVLVIFPQTTACPEFSVHCMTNHN